VIEKCIEMSGVLPKKSCVQKSCQLTDWSVGGSGSERYFRILFCNSLQNSKKFQQVLDFQRFEVLAWLWSGFGVGEKSLTFNASLTSRKCLIFNAFTHLYGAGRVGC
jgi:hypothetical protein